MGFTSLAHRLNEGFCWKYRRLIYEEGETMKTNYILKKEIYDVYPTKIFIPY